MSTTANYAATPRAAQAQISAANTNRDGTGTVVDVMAGGSNGSRIDDLEIVATGTTTAGMVRLFLTFDGGTTKRLWKEIPVSATTPSGTVAAWTSRLTDLALILPNANAKLMAATHNAETFNVFVTRAGDF